MFSELITFVDKDYITDDYGDRVEQRNECEVFGRMDRVYLSEAIQGEAAGLKPEYRFTLSDYYDYNNEEYAVYDGKEYRILNTQRKGTRLEINLIGDVENAAT